MEVITGVAVSVNVIYKICYRFMTKISGSGWRTGDPSPHLDPAVGVGMIG